MSPFGRFLTRFAPEFLSPTWAAWRACVAALFGDPVTDAEAAIIRACTDRDPPTEPAREGWFVVGRRGGKSRIVSLIAVFIATARDYSRLLAPGERGVVLLVGADLKQGRVLMRYIAALLHDHPVLAAMVTRETSEEIELMNGIVIEVATSSYRTVRGRTIVAALLDELAFWVTDVAGASPDVEVVNAIRPAMATIPNALLLGLSSPYRRAGVLWTAFKKYFGKSGDVLVWNSDTRTMDPQVPARVIDQAFAEDEANAAAEYGRDGRVEFRSDLEGYISLEAVEAITVKGRTELQPEPGVSYAAFCDPSGGTADSFTLAIAHKDPKGRAVLDLAREKRAPCNPEVVTDEFCGILHYYGVSLVGGDHYAGEWPRARFERRGITYRVSDLSKSEIYVAALPILTSGHVELLDSPRLIHQLVNLERKTARSGKDSIDHPPRGNDDVINAAAGALVAVTTQARCSVGLAKLPAWM